MNRLLIANRGEIAIRIARAATDLGIGTVAIHSEDDASSLHVFVADTAQALPGNGASAYLNIDEVIAAAKANDCDAIHPGYGFLAENADLARAAAEAGITFVGPQPEILDLFGDKAEARKAAQAVDVPVVRGLDDAASLEDVQSFHQQIDGPIIVKAIAGGGGRGSRVVESAEELENAYERARSEAKAAFGNDAVYVEELLQNARHIEVQIIGDSTGSITHLGERECSVQRRHQKIVEIAPAAHLDKKLRLAVIEAAVKLAKHVDYQNLGTFEFLVHDKGFNFIEVNARLQVEHTVTEEVTGVDIVQTQLAIARGETLAELDLSEPVWPRGSAVQARVNMESMREDGTVLPSGGTLTAYDAPSGPGVRADGFGYTGYATSPNFDSLLAKIIARGASYDVAVRRCSRALSEFRIEGVETNMPFLQNVLNHADFLSGKATTRWVDENVADLAQVSAAFTTRTPTPLSSEDGANGGFAGARVDSSDPLALFDHDAKVKAEEQSPQSASEIEFANAPEGATGLSSPIQGTIVSVDVEEGDEVRLGQQVAVVEAMKMEHVIKAIHDGIVNQVTMSPGDVVRDGYPIVFVSEAEVSVDAAAASEVIDPDYIRPDLALTYERHAYILDENRAEAVEKRYARGYRMPRENIAELMDPDSFKEYWPLIVARQHTRHDMETLRRNTPADGLIAGVGTVNADLFGEEAARTTLVHYDYTVLAGTQGGRNHYKQDRMFELSNRFRIPLILFGEGGGGRPGDDGKGPGVAFDTYTFTQFSKLSGLVPLNKRDQRQNICWQHGLGCVLRRDHRNGAHHGRHGRSSHDRRRWTRHLHA